ncbi:MAG: alcohol dehydrogenase catalytic domain-containing protein [Nitrososphaerota archaeon]
MNKDEIKMSLKLGLIVMAGDSMLAAFLLAPSKVVVRECNIPRPSRGEVLVRVRACGVCPTDLRYIQGLRLYLPMGEESCGLTGHEWAGDVVEVGEGVEGVSVGDRVVADHILSCGRCIFCKQGRSNLCINKRYYLRGYAQYAVAHAYTALKIPPHVSFEEACLTEPLSTCLNTLEKLEMGPGSRIAIIGDGVIGLLHLQLARLVGAEAMVIGHHPDRLRVAERLGAVLAINSRDVDAVDVVRKETGGLGADKIVVATGGKSAIGDALRMVAPGGRIGIFAGTYPPTSIDLDPNMIHYGEVCVIGIMEHTPHHFERALNLISRGLIDVKQLITHRFPLEKINEAFEVVKSRRGLKVIVSP